MVELGANGWAGNPRSVGTREWGGVRDPFHFNRRSIIVAQHAVWQSKMMAIEKQPGKHL